LPFPPVGFQRIIAGKEDQPMNAPRNTQYRYLETHRIAGSLGAEVSGVDLSEDLPDDVLAEIRAALLDNCVIFFRDQKLTPEQQLRFARRWGEIHLHPFMQGMPGLFNAPVLGCVGWVSRKCHTSMQTAVG
jgi:alpha-ketoglutarate-dependent taurine dioxygenase